MDCAKPMREIARSPIIGHAQETIGKTHDQQAGEQEHGLRMLVHTPSNSSPLSNTWRPRKQLLCFWGP